MLMLVIFVKKVVMNCPQYWLGTACSFWMYLKPIDTETKASTYMEFDIRFLW